MVNRAATGARPPARVRRAWLGAGLQLVAVMIFFAPVQAAAASSGNATPGLGQPFLYERHEEQLTTRSPFFDPAFEQFFSLLSYSAMSIMAPTIYGDFENPVQVSLPLGLGAFGPMSQDLGFDPAVSAEFIGILQNGLLPELSGPDVEEFSVGSSVFGVPTGAGASSGGDGDASGPPPGAASALPSPTLVALVGGIRPACDENVLESDLQAAGEFWNGQGRSVAPIQFPQGVFAGAVVVGDPLGGLGPTGEPTNLPPPAQPGDWCIPRELQFSLSSPIEDTLFWIALYILLGSALVFYVSRGVRLPA